MVGTNPAGGSKTTTIPTVILPHRKGVDQLQSLVWKGKPSVWNAHHLETRFFQELGNRHICIVVILDYDYAKSVAIGHCIGSLRSGC